ncbi:putative DNA-directed DNA polymerase [Microsporum audouinii]
MSTNEAGGAEPNGKEFINTQAGETDGGDNAQGSEGAETGLSVDDILLPRSVIMRLAKDMLPPGTGVQRDAVTAILKAATVFVSYISSHANDMTDKKTLTPQDVLAALTEVELGDFRPHLEKQLKAYTAIMDSKRESKKKGKSGKDGSGGQDDPPGSKRLKRDNKEQETAAGSGNGTSSTRGATRETGSRKNQRETLHGADGGRPDDEDDDDTEAMEDTNLSNEEEDEEEEPGEEETESHGEQEDDMDRIEDSDSQRRAAAADSGDSDSD